MAECALRRTHICPVIPFQPAPCSAAPESASISLNPLVLLLFLPKWTNTLVGFASNHHTLEEPYGNFGLYWRLPKLHNDRKLKEEQI